MGKSKLKDFDPESLLDPAPSSSNENSDSEYSSDDNADAGREHYAEVGKSKLRKKEVVPLGPQYTGSKIGREEIEDEDSDDPFARGFDEDESEDGSDDEDDQFGNGIALGGDSDEEADEVDEAESGSDEEMDGAEDAEDDEDDASEDDSEQGDDQAVKLREMMKESKNIATTLSAAAQSDIQKGNAVKRQRKTFDGLLNTRIRLQKALISTNTTAVDDKSDADTSDSSVEAAEAAALTLLNNLTNLRVSLDEARTGQKRKRADFTSETASSDIWQTIKSADAAARAQRGAVLEKWSTKTRAASVNASKGRLNSDVQQTLTDVLASQVANSSHLVARTQTPRSCAPGQSEPSTKIYDDADFYGLLLKELLEQRSADLSANGAGEFVVEAPWKIASEAKTKKVVDTKASKGRRLRYTVHEKLQNFLAPEDRGEWGDRQREELFSSLFGQRLALGENDEVQSEEEDEAADAEEQGLMLFRS
ncbi:TRAUB-domain-containing protein [Corynespora cassiicola Philippines]|uniref:Protein BFR2 n=1 Tax=Corynespora cassiicola Philippines TaxID=1448308 RepID=A0A2T2P8W8_CORCC|nr:TRAUB-domain-containing protein [Corynespora cassiicola Philippines]